MAADVVTLGDDLLEQAIEAEFAAKAQGLAECGGQLGARLQAGRGGRRARDQPPPCLAQHQPALAIVEHVEMGRNIRLQRELVEDRLAKGMDRLDFQPARRFQRLGEELAGLGQPLGRGRTLFERLQLLGKRVLARDGPGPEALEDTICHLRGRRLGEGKAENLGRIGAGEEQANHPLGQDMGLAGAGIGGDEDRPRRIGRKALLFLGPLADGECAHSSPPSSSPPVITHSRARDR